MAYELPHQGKRLTSQPYMRFYREGGYIMASKIASLVRRNQKPGLNLERRLYEGLLFDPADRQINASKNNLT